MDSKEFSTGKVDIATLPGAIRALRDSDSSSSSCESMIIPARPVDPASSPLASLSSESEPDSSVDNCKTHGVIKDCIASSNFSSKDNELNKGAAIDDSKGSMDMSLTYEYESKVQILKLTREHISPKSAPMSQSSSNESVESAKSARTHLSAPSSDLFKLVKERRHLNEAEWLRREFALRQEAEEKIANIEQKWKKEAEKWQKEAEKWQKEAEKWEKEAKKREKKEEKWEEKWKKEAKKWEEKWEEKEAKEAKKSEEKEAKWEEKEAKWEEKEAKWEEKEAKWEEKEAKKAKKWEEKEEKWEEKEEKWEEKEQQWDEERQAWRIREEELNKRLQQAERAGRIDQG